MSEAKEDFEKINSFLRLAQLIDKFKDCHTVYDLFEITNKNAPYPDIEKTIESFVKLYAGSNAPKFKHFGRGISGEAETVKRVLRDHRKAYNEYLQESDPKIKKLREDFKLFTEYDEGEPTLDRKEKNILITRGIEAGFEKEEIITFINNWVIEDGVKETDEEIKSEIDSRIPYDALLNKTYYEILGVPEDTDYEKIKEAYEREHVKYNTARDKAKASARFYVVTEAWECLRDPTKRREYDEKLKQPITPVPTGIPRLVVECKSDYTFKDVRRGMIIHEKIIIKNPEGGLLQGTIKSDSPWLEPDRNKVLEKHEQELYVSIVTSRIPPKTPTFEGRITIDTNGGSQIIPFKVFLENYEIELQRFRKTWPPLSAAVGGFMGSFAGSQNLWTLAYITAIPFGIWYKMQYISEQGIKKDLEIIKQIVFGILMGVGGLIVVAILQAIFQSLPHFSGFLIGAFVFGIASYLLSKQGLEFSLNKRIDISKYPPIAFQGMSIALVVLAIIAHSGSKSDRNKPATALRITRSVIAEGLDSNNNPKGINTKFPPGNKTLYYHVSYTGGAPNKTVFVFRWNRSSKEISSSQLTLKYESGNAWAYLPHDYEPGKYEVRLYVDGNEIRKSIFAIEGIPKPQFEADIQTKPFRMKTWGFGPGRGKGVDVQLVSVDAKQDKITIGFSVRSDDHKDILLYGKALQPDPTGYFYGESLYIVDDRGKKVYSTAGFVGGRQSKFNSSANQIILEPGEEIFIFAEFPKVGEDAKTVKFVSPMLHGHQNDWSWDKIPIKSFDIRKDKSALIIPKPDEKEAKSAKKEVKAPEVEYLSDLQPDFVEVGHGSFERDAFRGNHKIILNGIVYDKGLSTHAPARLIFRLNEKYSGFDSYIGLWDSGNRNRGVSGDFAGQKGSVCYRVFLDGRKAYDSGVLRWSDMKHISISVKGARQMELIVDKVDNNHWDWSVWGDAKLVSDEAESRRIGSSSSPLKNICVTARVSNADDRAIMYVNDKEAITNAWGEGENGKSIGHRAGDSGWVDITSYVHKGINKFRFWVWNNPGCCDVSGKFEVVANGKVVITRDFYRKDSSPGVKYDETFEIELP